MSFCFFFNSLSHTSALYLSMYVWMDDVKLRTCEIIARATFISANIKHNKIKCIIHEQFSSVIIYRKCKANDTHGFGIFNNSPKFAIEFSCFLQVFMMVTMWLRHRTTFIII